jgi:dUTP pyrophosphatase
MKVEIRNLVAPFPLPSYSTEHSAGMDLTAVSFKMLFESGNNKVDCSDKVQLTLIPGARVLIGCGFAVALPVGFEMQIRPRSGLALKEGLTVLNSPGTIDADYRGEVGVILINHSTDATVILLGDRIAQAVITSHQTVQWNEVKTLSETVRGTGGYGSTGVNNKNTEGRV